MKTIEQVIQALENIQAHYNNLFQDRVSEIKYLANKEGAFKSTEIATEIGCMDKEAAVDVFSYNLLEWIKDEPASLDLIAILEKK